MILPPLLVGAVTFACTAIFFSRRRARWLARRVLVPPRRAAAPELETREEAGLRARLAPLFAATEARLGGSSAWQALDRLVERAASPLRTVELLYAAGAASLAAGALVVAAGGSARIALPAAMLVLLAVRLVLGVRARRRARRFEARLPELLRALAAALESGHSFLQALQAVAPEAGDPARGELERVLAETRLGRSVEQALADLGRRIDSPELRFVLDAVVIQRQVGGSLAGIFEIVADAVAQRQQFLLKVRALTATARASSTVLMALPVAVAGLLTAVNPAYMHPLFATSTGRLLLVAAAGMMGSGALWLRKIASFPG